MIVDSLHQLIHSLNKSEKRYFKLHASRHSIGEGNNYLRLFDFLAAENEYNEDRIRNAFAGEALLNRFSITKNRLYEQILQTLVLFHQSRGIESKIFRFIQSAEILSRKRLYQQASRLLNQASNLCDKYGLPEWTIIVREKQEQLQESTELSVTHPENVYYFVFESLQTRLRLREIRKDLLNRLQGMGGLSTKEQQDYFSGVLADLPVEREVQKWNASVTFMYLQVKGMCYIALDSPENIHHCLLRQVSLLDEKCVNSSNLKASWLSSIINGYFLAICFYPGKAGEIFWQDLRTLRHKVEVCDDEFVQLQYQIHIKSIELSSLIHQNRFGEAHFHAPNVEALLFKHQEIVSKGLKRFTYQNIIALYFIAKKYKEVRKCWSSFMQSSTKDAEEVYLQYLLMNLLMSADQGDTSHVSHLIGRIMRVRNKTSNCCLHVPGLVKLATSLVRSHDPFIRDEIYMRYKLHLQEKVCSMKAGACNIQSFVHWISARQSEMRPGNLRKIS